MTKMNDTTAGLAAAGAPHTSNGTIDSTSTVAPVAGTSSTLLSEGSSSKKKKNKKKKKTAGGGNATATAGLMQQLRVDCADGDRIEQLSCELEVLKETSDASEEQRATSARDALAVVDILRASVKRHITAIEPDKNAPVTLADAVDASRAIFLLNKFHRQLPVSPLRPRHSLWQRGPPEQSLSPLEKLLKRAGSAWDFMDFLTFAAYTSRLLGACGRLPQAKEVLDVVERRLLKFRQRSPLFREYVGYFLDSRESAGIDPLVNPLTPEAERQFEWYASDNGIPDEVTLLQLDMLHGCKHFVRLKCVESFASPRFERFIDAVDARKTAEMDCVCIDQYVVAGAATADQAKQVAAFLLTVAQESGLHFDPSDMAIGTTKLELLGFEFSATEIVGKVVP